MNVKPTPSEQQSFYQTGHTKPPKNYRGPICYILMLLILLSGTCNALGFQPSAAAQSEYAEATPLSFSPTETPESADRAMVTDAQQYSLGLFGQSVSQMEQVYYRIPKGLCITEVCPDSDAASLGIRPGDVLLRINNLPISDYDSLQSAVCSSDGEVVELVIYRSGQQFTLQILVDEATE